MHCLPLTSCLFRWAQTPQLLLSAPYALGDTQISPNVQRRKLGTANWHIASVDQMLSLSPQRTSHLLGFQLSERLPTSGIKPFTQVLRLWQLTSWSKQVSSSTGINNLLPLIITWSGPGFYLKAIFSENTLNLSILFNMVSMQGYLLLNKLLPQKTAVPLPFMWMNSNESSPTNLNVVNTWAPSHKPKLKSSSGLFKPLWFPLSLKSQAILTFLGSSKTCPTHRTTYQYPQLINISPQTIFLVHGEPLALSQFSSIISLLTHKQQFVMWQKLIEPSLWNQPNGQGSSFSSTTMILLPLTPPPFLASGQVQAYTASLAMPLQMSCDLEWSAQYPNGLMTISLSTSSNATYPITISNKVDKHSPLPKMEVVSMSEDGWLWYQGRQLEDNCVEEFDEDMSFPLMDLSETSPRSECDARYTYCIQVSMPAGC